ncbi:DUF1840 domain-containing protein [Variovorax sp. HJSM1_2]|uniref:DUF1840 domain-containing protein n=1 Tax=Variovorax sp. HJSM1_2 TaxID=3366263 RepID=UPI003BD817B0
MLYKFKSKNAADVIMLEPNGRQILQIIGKSPAGQGIITASETASAISALTEALAREDQATSAPTPGSAETAKDDNEDKAAPVSLRQRAAPFLELLRRAQKDGSDIVWGV